MEMTLWGKFSGQGHDDQFHLTAHVSAIENGPWLWQNNGFNTNYSDFFKFCDWVEASTL